MSYDLYFHFRDVRVPLASISKYFEARPHYKLNPGQALYKNEKTGVYFSFEWSEPATEAGDGEESELAFNLNYCRPHPFALEAEPEIAAFVQEFNLSVEDPQISGTEGSTYSREGLLRGWNAGNKVAWKATRGSSSVNVLEQTLPSEVIAKCWSWNMAVPSLQDQLGENIFVPSIMFCRYQGRLTTLVVWTDAIPIAFPEVDIVVFYRDQTAKPQLLFFKKPTMAVLSYESLSGLLESFPLKEGAQAYRLLAYKEPPENVLQLFKNQPSLKEQYPLVPFDQILDRELLEPVSPGSEV